MVVTTLRKVGGSVMLSVPPALLDMLQLSAGSTVGLSVEDGRLVVAAQKPPRYTLEQLLAACDADAPMSDEDRDWLNAPAAGNELP